MPGVGSGMDPSSLEPSLHVCVGVPIICAHASTHISCAIVLIYNIHLADIPQPCIGMLPGHHMGDGWVLH